MATEKQKKYLHGLNFETKNIQGHENSVMEREKKLSKFKLSY